MAKVNINKNEEITTASKEKINEANKIHIVTDETGRTYKVKIPTFQDNLKYDLYFGKHEENNKRFYESNKFVMFVKEINEMPVGFPTTTEESLALAARLGNEGMAAIMRKIEELFEAHLPNGALTEEEEQSTLKK